MNQTQFERLKKDASATFRLNELNKNKQQAASSRNKETTDVCTSPTSRDSKRNPLITPAVIIAVGLIVASIIYAYAHRYNIQGNYIEDKWTGTYQKLEERK